MLRDSCWRHKHPSDLWYEFLDETRRRDDESHDDYEASSEEILAAFKGWAVGRYNVPLTRGEIIDAMAPEWERGLEGVRLTLLKPERKRIGLDVGLRSVGQRLRSRWWGRKFCKTKRKSPSPISPNLTSLVSPHQPRLPHQPAQSFEASSMLQLCSRQCENEDAGHTSSTNHRLGPSQRSLMT
ncbi:unnamed protein product [Symbiodinium necroappetens]|uniref:Uncharacterized protein n=1 Tax=Symbiodinium necroappetens TaxID=1628268 RepID=A0A813A767_9DINO|nr:unnamed protein product [Symbiodinium necroappetens]